MPPPEACAVERTLHRELLADPRRPVARGRDRRDRRCRCARELAACAGVPRSAAAASDAGGGLSGADPFAAASALPPLFVNQLVHVILRNALDGCDDPLRAARRPSCSSGRRGSCCTTGSLLAGDEETIGGTRQHAGVVADVDAGAASESQDRRARRRQRRRAIGSAAINSTWRSISPAGKRGPAALAEAMTRWIAHLLGVDGRHRAAHGIARCQAHLVCRA